MKYPIFRVPALIMTLTVSLSANAAEPTLQEIMQGLGDDFTQMTDALLRDEPELVRQAAGRIAQHPPISEDQRSTIAATLGAEMLQFAKFDQTVHRLAVSISEMSPGQGPLQVQPELQEMLNACLTCHVAYKARVSSALRMTESGAKSTDPGME